MGISGGAPCLAPCVTRVGVSGGNHAYRRSDPFQPRQACLLQAQVSPRVAAQGRPGPCLGAPVVYGKYWGASAAFTPGTQVGTLPTHPGPAGVFL